MRVQHEHRRPADRVGKHGRRGELRLRLEFLVDDALDFRPPRLEEAAKLPVALFAVLAVGSAHVARVAV